MSFVISASDNIAMTLESHFDVSSEAQKSCQNAIKAQEFRFGKFDMRNAEKNKSATMYAVAYHMLLMNNKELAKNEYVARTKNGPVTITIGEFIGKQVTGNKELTNKSIKSVLRFNRLIKSRVKQLDTSLDYGYDKSKDFEI